MKRGALIVLSVLALGAGAVLAVRSDDHASYETEEVVEAFAQEGFRLHGSDLNLLEEALLTPESGEPFFVYVAVSDRVAQRQFATYERLRTPETFDVIRGNVLAISDSGLGRRDRQRVRSAMDALSASEAAPYRSKVMTIQTQFVPQVGLD